MKSTTRSASLVKHMDRTHLSFPDTKRVGHAIAPPWFLIKILSSCRRPKVLAVGKEFVSESDDFAKGFLVEPCSYFVQTRKGGCEKRAFRKHWQEKTTRTHEFVMTPKGNWCYMGRYKGSSPVTMEVDDFRNLPKKVFVRMPV
jgi:hypothetical protein